MEDGNNNNSDVTVPTNVSVKTGLGRGTLVRVLGDRLRGIGRGSGGSGQVNGAGGTPGSRDVKNDDSHFKVKDDQSHRGGFGNQTDGSDNAPISNRRTGGFGSANSGSDRNSENDHGHRGGFGKQTNGSDEAPRSNRRTGGFGSANSGSDRNSESDQGRRGGFGKQTDESDGAPRSKRTGGFGSSGKDKRRQVNGSSDDEASSGFGGITNGRVGIRGGRGRGRGGGFSEGSSRGSFGGKGGSESKARDWICPEMSCGNKNFAFRIVCQKCETPKPDNAPDTDKSDKPQRYIPPAPSDKEEDIFGGAVQKGTNFDKYDDIPVEVSGRDQCRFISSFEEAGFHPTFLQNIKRANYEKPTPIQKYSIPVIISGRDLMACAQTGSGKTAAFLLPVLTGMINQGLATDEYQSVQSPQAICVAPTRELAIQIYNDCRKFAYRTDIRAVVLYGGTSLGHQLRQVEHGAHFVIGTPGRLLDVISRGKISLANVSFVILDEADRMLDMGFEPEVRKLVETLGMPPKTERQTLMFSATFPEEIQKLAADFLNDYLFITVGRVGGANTDVSQNLFEVDRLDKRDSLCDILNAGGSEKTLVFVELKRNADFLASYLCQSGFPTTSIHGDRLQKEREEALMDFKSGKAHVLVATSVAARGLDIPEVMHVVNYDLPSSIDEYVHRIGRTGRCGNLGKATSFYSTGSDQPIAADLVRILKEACQPVPDWLAEQARGMGAGDSGTFNTRFGSKDIRTGKPFVGGSKATGGENWAAGSKIDAGNSDDEDWEDM